MAINQWVMKKSFLIELLQNEFGSMQKFNHVAEHELGHRMVEFFNNLGLLNAIEEDDCTYRSCSLSPKRKLVSNEDTTPPLL